VHAQEETGENFAKKHVRQTVEYHVMRKQEYAGIVALVIGMTTVIKIVRTIVGIHRVVNVTECVIIALMVGMVIRATIRVIRIVQNANKKMVNVQNVTMVSGENSVKKRVFRIVKYVTN
jgi:hypothetical protein